MVGCPLNTPLSGINHRIRGQAARLRCPALQRTWTHIKSILRSENRNNLKDLCMITQKGKIFHGIANQKSNFTSCYLISLLDSPVYPDLSHR